MLSEEWALVQCPGATDQILGIVTGESRVTKLFLTPVYSVTNGNDVDVGILITLTVLC